MLTGSPRRLRRLRGFGVRWCRLVRSAELRARAVEIDIHSMVARAPFRSACRLDLGGQRVVVRDAAVQALAAEGDDLAKSALPCAR